MMAEEMSMESVHQWGPYLVMGAMWLIIFVATFQALAHSTFTGASRPVIAFCASTLALYGGYELYLEMALPAYVAMGAVILLGVAGIIRGGFKKIKRDSERMQSDDDSET